MQRERGADAGSPWTRLSETRRVEQSRIRSNVPVTSRMNYEAALQRPVCRRSILIGNSIYELIGTSYIIEARGEKERLKRVIFAMVLRARSSGMAEVSENPR